MEPSKVIDYHNADSVEVTAPFVSLLTHNSSTSVLNIHDETLAIKQDVHRTNHKLMSDKFDASCLYTIDHLVIEMCQHGS